MTPPEQETPAVPSDLPGTVDPTDAEETPEVYAGARMADEEPSANGAGPSILDTLREQYAEADAERRTTLMIVPGRFNSSLAARYRAIPWPEYRKKVRRAQRQGESEEAELNHGASIIADACEEILVRPEPGAALVPMHLSVDGMGPDPVRFDSRLAAALGIDASGLDSTAVCRLVFKNPAALNGHFAELDAFMREQTQGEEDEDGDRPI